MKKVLFLLFLLFCSSVASAQVITGYVYDETEKKPLEGAFVYLDGTTINTSTDANGFFELKASGQVNTLLVVNYLGFERYLLENPFSVTGSVTVYLKEKNISLNEVVINKKQMFTRKQLLRAFKDQFLGQTSNGESCSIENENDIVLSYDVSANVLSAYASNPLIVVNKRLGYRVLFDLVEFKTIYKILSVKNTDVNSSFFAGTTAFTDISGKNGEGEKRKKAYLGSPMHFLRSVAAQNLEKESFRLYIDKFPMESSNCFKVTDTLGVKKVKVTFPDHSKPNAVITMNTPQGKPVAVPKTLRYKKLVILYKEKQQSFVTFDTGELYIDNNGLFVPINEIYFGGYMSLIKAGDMLPADYSVAP